MWRISTERSYYQDRRMLCLWSCLTLAVWSWKSFGGCLCVTVQTSQASTDIEGRNRGKGTCILYIHVQEFLTYIVCFYSFFFKMHLFSVWIWNGSTDLIFYNYKITFVINEKSCVEY